MPALLALLALLCWQPCMVQAECTARFEVVAGQQNGTSLKFSGTSAYSLVPGSFPVKLNDPSTLVGLSGVMFASAPSAAACPADAAGWRALGALSVSSAPSRFYYQPLQVFPEMLYANVLRVPLNISRLALNLTLSVAGGAAAGAAFPVAVQAAVTDGYVFSNTSITGGPQLNKLNVTGTFSSEEQAAFEEVKGKDGRRWLHLVVPEFSVNFSSFSSSAFKGSGRMDFALRGRLVMRAPLSGCVRDCGPHGRCAAAGGAGKATTAACECECGWGADRLSGACTVPLGYCSIYGGAAAVTAVGAGAPAAGAGAGAGAAAATSAAPAAAAGATCPAGFGYNVRTEGCDRCSDGFGGPGCSMCSSDAACAAKAGAKAGKGATCASGLTFAERSREKHYSCSLSDPSIAQVVGPVLAFSCSTVGPNGQPAAGVGGAGGGGSVANKASGMAVDAAALIGNSPHCSIELRLGDMPANQTAVCNGWGCHFGSGDASWLCDAVVCECPNGCATADQDYRETFENVKGEVTLDCDQKTSKCLLNVGSLEIKLEATCDASECIDTDGPVLVGEAKPRAKGKDWLHPVVAAIPAALLFIGAAACCALMLGALPYLRPGHGAASSGAVSSGVAPPAAGPVSEGREETAVSGGGSAAALSVLNGHKPTIQELSWQDLVVRTKVVSGPCSGAAGRLAARVSGALRRGGGADGGARASVAVGGSGFSDDDGQSPTAAAAEAAAAAAAVAAGGGAVVIGVLPPDGDTKATDQLPAAAPLPAAGKPGGRRGGSGGGADAARLDRWKTILHGVSGAVRAREVAGVLGPSGSGKSTLLSALTGSLASDSSWRVRGRVCLDGVPASAGALARATALVPQDDLLLRSLTVEECLLYSAALRLPPVLPPAAVHARVDSVMRALKIAHVRGSVVWSGTGAAAGVSGGERRRVAIGMELVTDPQVLVLDEPTSGLDSFTALNLLRTLRAVAERGHAVMLSLHQPSPVLFDAMDQVLLMADGITIFSGAPSAAAAGMALLGAPVPPGVSVAEHMLHQVADPESHALIVERAAGLQRARQLDGAEALAAPPPARPASSFGGLESAPSTDALSRPAAGPRGSSCGGFSGKGAGKPRSLRREFGVLFWRSLADMLRNPMLTAFHALGGLVLGLLVGIIFYQVGLDTTGAQNRLGAIFFGLALMAFTSVTSIDLVQSERHAAAREMRRSYYSPLVYSVTKLVLDGVLLRALPALLFAVPFYFLMGLSPGGAPFMTFALIFITFNATVGALALALAAALDSPGKTVLAMNLVLLVGVLFAGFLANKESIPLPLRWITYLSVFRYAWEAMVINELRSLYLYFTAPNVSITVSMKGTVFLDIIGVKDEMLLPDIGVLVAMYAGCCVLLCFVMHWRYGRRHG